MALNCQSIKTMFKAQQLCISQRLFLKSENIVSLSLIEKNSKKVSEYKETIKDRAIYNLFKLMCLKIKQFKKYKAVLISQSNLYLKHQIVKSFL